MPALDGLYNLLGSLTADQVILGLLVAIGLMAVVEERRLSLSALLVQYLLLGALVGPELYRPIAMVRMGLGVAVCLVLYITAWHVERVLHRQYAANGQLSSSSTDLPQLWQGPFDPAVRGVSGRGRTPSVRGMGALFRFMVLALAVLVAYGLWRTYPLELVPASVNLTSYLLVSIGLMLTLTSADPLRMGLGVLTFVNGFEGTYLFLENSLVMIALLSVVDIVVAFGIVACAEMWLLSLGQEAAT